MSSELDGVVAVTGGLMALTVGAALGGVVGAGWVLYNSGRLVVNAVSGINAAVEEKARRDRLERQLRLERAEGARERIEKICRDFVAETQKDLRKISDPELARRMEALLKRAKSILGNKGDTALEALNAADVAELDELVRLKNGLLEEAKIPAVSMGQKELSRIMADIQCELRAAVAAGETIGVDVAAMDAEQFERIGLRERFNEAVLRVRAALETEDRRAKTYPVCEEYTKSLHRLFDGIAERVISLNDPSVPNKSLLAGLKRLEDILGSYDLMVAGLNEEEAEFATLYPVYREAMEGLCQVVKKPHEFADLAALKAELEKTKEQVERAQWCAQALRSLGEDAYMVLAFDTEMVAMGYQVVESRRLMEQMRAQLKTHVCEGNVEIPAFDMPDGNGVTQMYTIDKSCRLQIIVREDGTTTLQTIMQGGDADDTVKAQKKHCEHAAELVRRLRENWFLDCGLVEMAPPEEVTTEAVGAALDPAARMTGTQTKAEGKVMKK